MTDHPLALPPGTLLCGIDPEQREVRYVHVSGADDPLDAGGLLQGDDWLVRAVLATVDGSDDHIDGDGGGVWLHALTEEHPTGLAHVTPSMPWFMPERDSLPDLALAIVGVLPEGSTLSPDLISYLRAIDEFRTDDSVVDGDGGAETLAETMAGVTAALTEAARGWVLTARLADGRWASWAPTEGWTGDEDMIRAAQAVADLFLDHPERVRAARGLMGAAVDGWVPQEVWVCAKL